MEGYFPLKLKRKDLEDVNDKFSDFSLTAPARKIRRLDGELPPIVEEEEYEIPLGFTDLLSQKPSIGSNGGGLKIEELPFENEEKAIVLFQPMAMEIPLMKPLSAFPDFSVSVDPQFIAEIKNQVMRSSQSNAWRQADSVSESDDSDSRPNNDCLAVIPWDPFTIPSAYGADSSPQVDSYEMMDAEEAEDSAMDVEDGTVGQETTNNDASSAGHLHQWQQQQQHFMFPNLTSLNPTTPIVWYR